MEHRVIVNGKQWIMSFSRDLPEGEDGSCDHPSVKGKKIKVRKSLPQHLELEVIIHELLHAASFEVLAEEFVDETSESIGQILWRLGWRKTL